MNTGDEDAVFQELMQIDANKRCFDCGQISPQWASVNNGIFVCLSCSGIHRSYGVDISFIRSVTMDSWNAKQLKCMQLGGNSGLGEFLSSYDLMSEPMDVRYQTKAAEYYRKKLKAFANDEEFNEEKPDYEEGRMPIEYRVKTSEELKAAIGGGPSSSNNDIWEQTKGTALKGVNYTKEGVNKLGEKWKESGYGDKISTGAKTVGTKTVEYGGIAYNGAKEGINKIVANEKVQEYSSKAYNGAKEGAKSMWGFFSNTYNKIANPDGQSSNDDGQGSSDAPGPIMSENVPPPSSPNEPHVPDES